MKKFEMAKAIGLADEKYVAEAAPRASHKAVFWRKFAIVAACISLVLTSVSLWLFLPYQKTVLGDRIDRNDLPTELQAYADSEYLDLMYAFYKYNNQNYSSPDNNYEKYLEDAVDDIFGIFAPKSESAVDGDYYYNSGIMNSASASDGNSPVPESGEGEVKNYVETTDNQVAGVIEADLFKRTKTHIFYLDYTEMVIRVYSIAGEESRFVSRYQLTSGDGKFAQSYSGQLFLSDDGNTLTFISNNSDVISYDAVTKKQSLSSVVVISLDVSDPENISEKARFEITGSFITARYVGGKILLMSKFNANSFDYSELSGFVPQINTGDGFKHIAAEDIIFPEDITSKLYTVVTQLDGESLEFEGAAACLGYSTEIYVSTDKIFLTRGYGDYIYGEDDGVSFVKNANVTEILALGYGKGAFEKLGKITVEGRVKNQYSLDEYNGILRVVTTTRGTKYSGGEIIIEDGSFTAIDSIVTNFASNAALYCIDIESWKIVGEVKDFAPDGESVESVRFDGTKAYVCTAEVITFTDPVYFFDLSDMSNITYTDTGVIEGYSSSLVNFGENTLLGIGYGDNRNTLKIEVYAESGNRVESLCSYELNGVAFSEDYKSYFIDRERGLVGLAVCDQSTGFNFRYILLAYNGYELVLLGDVRFDNYIDVALTRATLADGYFYIVVRDKFEFFKVFG